MVLYGSRQIIIPPGFMRIRSPKTAAAPGWWLTGGIAAANCIAAYQPKGAASLAASYDNTAAPGNGAADGTNDAAPGVAPTFDTAVGWTFNGSNQYLTLGNLAWTETWTLIVRVSGSANNKDCLGGFDSTLAKYVMIKPTYTDFTVHAYYNGGAQNAPATLVAAGVLAIAGANCYKNGAADGTITGLPSWTLNRATYVGSRQYNNAPNNYWQGNMQALAFYNTILSAAQVLAVSTAMAAL